MKTTQAKYIRTIDKILTKGFNEYGAFMGRPNIDTCPKSECNGQQFSYTGTLYDAHVRLDTGGYDKGGAYWGHGRQLRVEYNKSLTWVRFYRLGDN